MMEENGQKLFKQMIKLCVCSVVSDSETTLTVAHQAPLSLEFSRQEYWSRLPYPSSRDFPNSGIECMHCRQILYHLSNLESLSLVQFSSVQSLSRVWLFVTAWIAARQASLSITNSQSSLRLTSIKSVMPSSHLILCRPLLLLPPNPSQHQSLFQWVNSLHEVAKVLEFQL